MENKDQNTQSKNNKWLIIAIFSILVNGVLAFLLYEEKQTVVYQQEENLQIALEKASITDELNEMLMKYDTLEVENEEMMQKIDEQKERIEQLLKESKDKNWTIHKLRKEAETLRDIMKSYIVTIDSLNTANQTLIAEKNQMTKELGKERQAKKELIKKTGDLEEKVRIGAKIEALNMTSIGQRVRSNNVHRETDRANRLEKIKTCFTISRNELTPSGPMKIYLRIISPQGKVLTKGRDENFLFEFEGIKGLFSLQRDIIYDNEELELCYYYDIDEADEIIAGPYIVEAYANDYFIGRTTFTLK